MSLKNKYVKNEIKEKVKRFHEKNQNENKIT